MHVNKILLAALALGLVGCHFAEFPDPNAMDHGQLPDAAVMQKNIQNAYSTLDQRVAKGDITPERRDELISELVGQFSDPIKVDEIKGEDTWRYADILRQGDRWEDSEKLYIQAVEIAESDDRRVNDSLQLARVQAHLGKVEEAIATARSTFDVKPIEKAPIMMSILYEILPEGLGKDKDIELAKLLEDAIDQHNQVVVDENLDPGKVFLEARSSHIRNAWQEVFRIYITNDARDELLKAQERARAMMEQTSQV
ncbi:MAG: tetratricopeptide repeat protein [Fimbriimonadaceae bacterium]